MTYVKKETACAIHAGIKPERRDRCHRQERVYACDPGVSIDCSCCEAKGWREIVAVFPTNHTLTEKLKAWCKKKDIMWGIHTLIRDGKHGHYTAFWTHHKAMHLGKGVASTEYKSFINAFYKTFCGKEQGDG